MRLRIALCSLLVLALLALCSDAQTSPAAKAPQPTKVIHVFVPLCDNKNQGIVPVPPSLGNGQDPKSNLYWGAQFGADTFFRQSPDWTAIEPVDAPKRSEVLATSVFITRKAPRVVVVMVAYDGRCMKAALMDFFAAAAGLSKAEFRAGTGESEVHISAGGAADLICFAGHDGLMDLTIDFPKATPGVHHPAGAVLLACMSHKYFAAPVHDAGCEPLITTTGLMSPEAYTLDAIIRSWASGDPPAAIRDHAASAYAKYQKCPLGSARKLFVAASVP